MTRKNLVCHYKFANIAFCKQSEEFKFTQPRSVEAVKFDYSSPIGFISQVHILSRKGNIGQVYGQPWLINVCLYVQQIFTHLLVHTVHMSSSGLENSWTLAPSYERLAEGKQCLIVQSDKCLTNITSNWTTDFWLGIFSTGFQPSNRSFRVVLVGDGMYVISVYLQPRW